MYDTRSMSRLMRSPLTKSMPRRLSRSGIGQNGRHITICTAITTHIVPTMNTFIICHVK